MAQVGASRARARAGLSATICLGREWRAGRTGGPDDREAAINGSGRHRIVGSLFATTTSPSGPVHLSFYRANETERASVQGARAAPMRPSPWWRGSVKVRSFKTQIVIHQDEPSAPEPADPMASGRRRARWIHAIWPIAQSRRLLAMATPFCGFLRDAAATAATPARHNARASSRSIVDCRVREASLDGGVSHRATRVGKRRLRDRRLSIIGPIDRSSRRRPSIKDVRRSVG